jgi:hypothetical protein
VHPWLVSVLPETHCCMRPITKLTGERRDLEASTLNGLRRWDHTVSHA